MSASSLPDLNDEEKQNTRKECQRHGSQQCSSPRPTRPKLKYTKDHPVPIKFFNEGDIRPEGSSPVSASEASERFGEAATEGPGLKDHFEKEDGDDDGEDDNHGDEEDGHEGVLLDDAGFLDVALDAEGLRDVLVYEGGLGGVGAIEEFTRN